MLPITNKNLSNGFRLISGLDFQMPVTTSFATFSKASAKSKGKLCVVLLFQFFFYLPFYVHDYLSVISPLIVLTSPYIFEATTLPLIVSTSPFTTPDTATLPLIVSMSPTSP